MNLKILLLLMAPLLLLSTGSFSQTKVEYSIKGVIADSLTNKPLDYITVSLKNDKNMPVKAALSKTDGSFQFNGLKQGKFLLSVVAVGYKSKQIKISGLDSLNPKKDLGKILISKSTTRLKELVVTGDKPIMTQEADRIAYNLQADPESKATNVLEMMRKVPLLSLDVEDNILLKGNNNFKILINGKPSSMVERNPKDILRSMPASTIEKIEVITTPPAKYDADGLAGIINIITTKKIDNGYNGSINANERFPVGGPGFGSNFTVKQGKFGASAFGGGSLHNSPETASSNHRFTSGTNQTSLIQNGRRESDNKSGYFGSELSYEIDSLNLISGQFNINGDNNNGLSNQWSVLSGTNGTMQSYQLNNTNEGKGYGIDAAFNYQKGFKSDKNRLLTFSYRFMTYERNQFASLLVTNPFNYSQPNYKQENTGTLGEQTLQLDYVHPIKKFSIEAGVKAILRDNKSNFHVDTVNNSGSFVTDFNRSNRFQNEQNVYSFYNSYQYNTKNLGIKAGLRLEKTDIDADFISSATQLNKTFLNLVPSVSINRKFKDMSNISLGYAYKIRRPGIFQLNPFVDRSNPNFESTGNPNLRPMSAKSIEMRYSRFKKGSFNVGLSYEMYDKLIMPISVFDAATNITRTSYGNTGNARLIGANLSVNYPITKKWNVNVNGQTGYGRVKGLVNNVEVRNKGLMYYVSTSSGYKFEKGWRTNVSANFNGPNLSLQGTSNRFIHTSVSVNKDIIKEKLSFSASANNPLSKYRYAINQTNGTNFTQESNNQNYFRTFSTSLNYRFGNLKSSLKKNKKGIVNDDVQSGGPGN